MFGPDLTGSCIGRSGFGELKGNWMSDTIVKPLYTISEKGKDLTGGVLIEGEVGPRIERYTWGIPVRVEWFGLRSWALWRVG